MGIRKLDFICIGAAKSGTTSLHEILKQHPEVYLPKAKEVPFFNDPDLMKKGYEWWYKKNFKTVSHEQRIGVVTPQYMYNRNGLKTSDIAENIHRHNPDIKLVVILRHPVDRAFSHYKTAQRRYGVRETFESAMEKLLSSDEVERHRQEDWDAVKLAFFGSEYGKILEPYTSLFPAENILVLFSENLKKNPEKTIQRVLKFVETDTALKIRSLEKEANINGSKPRIGLLTPKYLHKPIVRNFWKALIPYETRKLIEVKINSWNTKVDKEKINTDTTTYKKLLAHYKEDISAIQEYLHPEVEALWQNLSLSSDTEI